MILKTERLVLRPVESYDVYDMYEYSKNPNVGMNAGWKPHASKHETQAVMRDHFLNKLHVFAIVLPQTHKLIGTMGLTQDPKRYDTHSKMLGYAIGEPYWGKGYATEAAHAVLRYAFDTLLLNLVSAYCYPENLRSRHVLEKIGLLYEGTLRQAEILYTGEVKDNLCFSITKEEYYSLSK